MTLALSVLTMLLFILPFYVHHRIRERRIVKARKSAVDQGVDEPNTIHPRVNPETCIGIGNCLKVCPEGDVLGFQNGQAVPIAPGKCIGHGLCERACPVNAIELVFGTAQRGIDIPRITEAFETNVPGIFVIGELGGMGLIANAFEQGRQCVAQIASRRRYKATETLDVVIVGCGPAGLSASLHCKEANLRYVTLEREDIGGTVRHYPRKKLVMSRPLDIPGYGKVDLREIQKERLIDLWGEILQTVDLDVHTHETVDSIVPMPDGTFDVRTAKSSYRTRYVVLAIGRRGVPRKLDVPGENLSKVMYSLGEPEAFSNDEITVVGGGDSAVEAALALAAMKGNHVAISYRRDRFGRIKPANRDRVGRAIEQGLIEVLWSTNVVRIDRESIAIRDPHDQIRTVPNTALFVFVGGQLPMAFLSQCGIAIDTKFGEPLN